jgi:hypothetical protein
MYFRYSGGRFDLAKVVNVTDISDKWAVPKSKAVRVLLDNGNVYLIKGNMHVKRFLIELKEERASASDKTL